MASHSTTPSARARQATRTRSTRASSSHVKLRSTTRSRHRSALARYTRIFHPRRRPPKHILKPHREFGWAEQCLIGIVGACFACVCITLVTDASIDPEGDAKSALARLATSYYEDYLYPTTVVDSSAPAESLENYRFTGFPIIRLRQLLLQGDNRDIYSKYFANDHYYCDPSLTTVIYTPHAPYGPRDYAIEYNYACEVPNN